MNRNDDGQTYAHGTYRVIEVHYGDSYDGTTVECGICGTKFLVGDYVQEVCPHCKAFVTHDGSPES